MMVRPSPPPEPPQGGRQTESLSSFPLGPPGGGCVRAVAADLFGALFERPAPPQLP